MTDYIQGTGGRLCFGDPDDPKTPSSAIQEWGLIGGPTTDDDGQTAPLPSLVESDGTFEFSCDVEESASLVAFRQAIDDDFADAALDFWTNHPGESSRVYRGLRTGSDITVTRDKAGDDQ